MPFLQNRLNCTENGALAADSFSVAKNQTPENKSINSENVKYLWVRAPKAMVYNQNFSDGAKLLYLILLDYQGRNTYAFPSLETLANDTGKSVRRVQQLLKELEAGGAIEVVAQPGWVNLYKVGLPPTIAVATSEPIASEATFIETDIETDDKESAQETSNVAENFDSKLGAASGITCSIVEESLCENDRQLTRTISKSLLELDVMQDSAPTQDFSEPPMKKIAAELDSTKLKNMCEKSPANSAFNSSLAQTTNGKRYGVISETLTAQQASKNYVKLVPEANLSQEQQKIVEMLKRAGVAQTVAERIALTNPKQTDVQRWIELAQNKTNPGGYLAVVLSKIDAAPPPNTVSGYPAQNRKHWHKQQRKQPNNSNSGAVAYMQRHQNELAEWQNRQSQPSNAFGNVTESTLDDDQDFALAEPFAVRDFLPQIKGIARQLDREACQYLKQANIEDDTLLVSFVGNYQPHQNVATWLPFVKLYYPTVDKILVK